MLNCLHVTASMDPLKGGVSQGLRNTIPEIQRLDVYNEVVCLDDDKSAYLGTDSFKIIPLSSRGPWAYSARLLPWLLKNMIRFDVVIVHGLWLYNSYAAYKAYKQINRQNPFKKIQLFIMPHGMLDPYFQVAKERKLKAVRNYIFWKLVENKVVNNSDGLLFTCQKELELARLPFKPYKPARELNVSFGIQPPPENSLQKQDAFFEICPQVKNNAFILFLGRIDSKKGVDLLVDAYQNLADNGVDLPFLVIAGPGLDKPYGQQLQQTIANSAALKAKIFFTGMIEGESKWGAFNACEAFVLPSHQENFGIAVVEAMACSKPVLISNQINIAEEIQKDEAGIVEDDSLKGVENLLLNWTKMKPEGKLQMGIKARASYIKNFTIAAAAKKLFHAISETHQNNEPKV